MAEASLIPNAKGCRYDEQKMEEAVAAWGVAKGAAEKRFADGRDAAAGAWLAALQQAQASAAEQLRSAQQRWQEVWSDTASLICSGPIELDFAWASLRLSTRPVRLS